MVDYSKAKIYRLVCNTTGLVYFGSTVQSLAKRKGQHQEKYSKFIDGGYHYITSFEIIKGENYSIILVEEFPCDNKEQLYARERHWIESNACVNKQIPSRTKEEYYQQNKGKIQQTWRKWYDKNKKNVYDYQKEYRANNLEKVQEYQQKYREQRKDEYREYQREYKRKRRATQKEAQTRENDLREKSQIYNPI